MADVVPFTASGEKPEDYSNPSEMIWICGNCSCISFYLYGDGSTECCHCGNRGEDTLWMEHRPEVTAANTMPEDKAPEYTDSVVAFHDGLGAKTWLQNRISEDTVAIILLNKSGALGIWQSEGFASRRKWVIDRMKAAAGYLLDRSQEVDTGDNSA